MCAIAGWVSTAPPAARRIAEMLDAQSHRGPDGSGVFEGGEDRACKGASGCDGARRVMLGHRRLAILDLSAAGRQPMTARDGRYTIVLNGEIFNYRELRGQLGGEFRSATDTEVLLEACAAWGVEQALGATVGMFAFALWDERAGQLTLARDRLGEKPLVYFDDGATLAFASELKALTSFHDRRVDPWAADAYLALGYVPAPLAIFQGCRKLEAGHLLQVKPGERPRIRRWWFPEHAVASCRLSHGDRLTALRDRTGEAVRLRLRADVPVALCLSGGVDSAAVAAECVRQETRPEAFTVRFSPGQAEDSEVAQARLTAKRCGLRHEIIETAPLNGAHEIERLVRHYDEPFADSSAWPSLALAKALGGRYKVILNGDGGDEAFGGYRHYERIAWKQAAKAAAAAAGWRDGWGGGRAGIYVQTKALFRADKRACLLNGRGLGNALDSLLVPGTGDAVPEPEGALKRAMRVDRRLHLANGLTYKTDIAFGAFGIEARAPFMDHRIVEWTQNLDPHDLVRGAQKKRLFREAFRSELPAEVLGGAKRGFGAPIESWLRGPLREWVADVLPSPMFEARRQLGWSGQRLWTLAVFSEWARQWKASW